MVFDQFQKLARSCGRTDVRNAELDKSHKSKISESKIHTEHVARNVTSLGVATDESSVDGK